jgi:hypothetical protein
MIGLILAVLALAVLFDKLPGNQVAWLVVLVCGLLVLASAALPTIPWPRRQPPSA